MILWGTPPKTPVVVRNLVALAATMDAIMVADQDDLAVGQTFTPWIPRSEIIECEPPVRRRNYSGKQYGGKFQPHPITITVPLWLAQQAELLFEDPA